MAFVKTISFFAVAVVLSVCVSTGDGADAGLTTLSSYADKEYVLTKNCKPEGVPETPLPKVVEILTQKNGKTYITSIAQGKTITSEIILGESTTEVGPKTTTVSGNVLTEESAWSTGQKIIVTRKYSDKELIVTVDSDGFACEQTFTYVEKA